MRFFLFLKFFLFFSLLIGQKGYFPNNFVSVLKEEDNQKEQEKEKKEKEENERKKKEEKERKEKEEKERKEKEQQEREEKEKIRKERESREHQEAKEREARENGENVCAIALFDFEGSDPADLPFKAGDKIENVYFCFCFCLSFSSFLLI